MRADNHGDGGILALLALVTEQRSHPKKGETGHRRWITLVGLALFGAALLWADGMITPVISVLGALEGLDVATPIFRPWIVPLALAILVSLFLVQKRGTAGIGAVFGPLMLVWFASIAALGIPAIARHPEVLAAVNPMHAPALLSRQRSARLPDSRLGGALRHRQRSALRRHGALRTPADPRRLVLAGLPGSARQLLRPGGAAARARPGSGREPVLRPGAGVVPLPAGGDRHPRRRHRLAGSDLRAPSRSPSRRSSSASRRA